jgi:predicted alpha/beta superfamily hydrolase
MICGGHGMIRKIERFRSKLLRNERDILIYLPPGYDEKRARPYAVFYLQDGQNLFDPATSFIPGKYWHVGETADYFIGNGAVEPLIIVGIYNIGKKRIREYTPTRSGRLGGGNAERYVRMIMEELRPVVESQYRVTKEAAHTGIGGSSLGGLLSLYAGLSYPNVFGRIAAMSPSVWWDRGWVTRFAGKVKVERRSRVWLDTGTREAPRMVPRMEQFRDALKARGWDEGRELHFEITEGAEHNEEAWAARVGPMLQFLFPGAERI